MSTSNRCLLGIAVTCWGRNQPLCRQASMLPKICRTLTTTSVGCLETSSIFRRAITIQCSQPPVRAARQKERHALLDTPQQWNMALEQGDANSLFGDVETDSLFGDAEVGDDGGSSLFMEDQGSTSGAATSQPQPLGPASFLTLPPVPNPLSLPPQPALQLISPTPPRETVQTSQAQDVSTLPSVDQPRPGSDSDAELELELELALRDEHKIDPPQVGRPVLSQDAQECQSYKPPLSGALPTILRPRKPVDGPPARIDLYRQNFAALLT